jgi:phosphoglycolate phosphatase
MKSNRYDLLVFDWDGTLVDSIERIVTSLQFAALRVLNTRIEEQSARDVIGLSLHTAIQRLLPGLQDEAVIENLTQTYSQHYLIDNPVPAPLFPGVVDMLQELNGRGYTLAIATGKSRRGLDRALAEHAVGHLFAETRCATEHLSKPDPEMLIDIIQCLRSRPERTLMVGDSEHDLQMAANAGVDAVGVTHGVHNEDVLNGYGPIACLDRVTDLPLVIPGNTDSQPLTDIQQEIA